MNPLNKSSKEICRYLQKSAIAHVNDAIQQVKCTLVNAIAVDGMDVAKLPIVTEYLQEQCNKIQNSNLLIC